MKDSSIHIPDRKAYDVAVIGAGPAGLMAAITAARSQKSVLVLEQKDRPCRKLYATGNGRCNFTNLSFDDKVFRGGDVRFAYDAYKRFDNESLMEWMKELGVPSRDISGYVYPYNEQARTVAEALLLECRRLDIDIRCGEKVVDIIKERSDFTVRTETAGYTSKNVIVAVGGKASPTHGSDGSLNRIIRKLGHDIILQRPALVPLAFSDKHLAMLAGVRLKCRISLQADGEQVSEETGEIIFNKDNISGIPVMQVSRYAVEALAEERKVTLILDLFPQSEEKELCKLITQTSDPDRTIYEALSLITNDKMAEYVADSISAECGDRVCDLTDDMIDSAIRCLKHLAVDIVGDCGFNRAQVTAGGVDTKQVDGDMGSRIVDGLYFAGEILDVDGTCGGYNLQWAFTSGHIAGSAVGK